MSTMRGANRSRPASDLTTPFVHFSGAEDEDTRPTNYGSIGESTFEMVNRSNATIRNEYCESAPWLKGQLASPYESTMLYFPTEAANDNVVTMMNPMSVLGSMLFFGRMKISANAYNEGIWAVGSGLDAGNDETIYLQFNGITGDLELRYINELNPIKTIIVMDAANVPNGGVEHRLLMLFDCVNGNVKAMMNEDNLTTTDISAHIAAYDMTGVSTIADSGQGLTIGNSRAGTTQGARAADVNNYLAGDYRDFSFFNVTDNADQVESNLAAIAQAFKRAPEGYLPNDLKDLIE